MHRSALVSLACASSLGLGLAAPLAQAADNDITTSFSGYGTIAGTMTSNGKYEYISGLSQYKGATDQLDIGGESRLGLQGIVNFGPQFSVTGQALAQRVGDKDFDIGTEWLFGQYEPISGLDIRLGRVVMPTFLLSDTRNVGYAQTWLRSPNEVYAVMPFKKLDGAQVLWRTALGPANVSTQLSYGKTSGEVHSSVQQGLSDAKNVISLAVSVEAGNWTARVSQSRFDVTESLALSATNTLDFTLKDKFISAGLQYDNGTAIVMSEWTRRTENLAPVFNEPLAAGTAWYVAAGWRIDKFTPLVRYVANKPAPSVSQYPSKSSVGLSLRYDAFRNVALKAQIDRYDASSVPTFLSPAATAGTKVNVMSFGADFVF